MLFCKLKTDPKIYVEIQRIQNSQNNYRKEQSWKILKLGIVKIIKMMY